MNGIDTTDPAEDAIPCLQSGGYGFVIRYISPNTQAFPAKRMMRPEALALSAAGIALAVVWEMLPLDDGAKAKCFTFDTGMSDAKAAVAHMEMELQAPEGAAIYFAIDYDTTAWEDKTIIAAYFAAIRDAFDAMGAKYRIGVYASGATIAYLKAKELIDLGWLTLSTGFRGSKGYEGWDIIQLKEVTVCGLDADTNEAKADFGQFTVQ